MFACSMFSFIATHVHPAMQAGEQLEELRNYNESHVCGSVRKDQLINRMLAACYSYRQTRNFEGGRGADNKH